ncbi:hypothetical protein [Paenibacillus macquariensis]|uniref:Uncharacterized protein n=1 Tax=Paenibacillus macquariensis TaxID=948756 RepID=A0ABY1KDU5_9BACL|nr:hypothetical protein [Paenibacillus macquariensis]MEC0094345.1 hypothetical protein [Paenibacillus macquariensis]OAB25382.1 hypothetical protein PMSM_28395 [Paenibacillus macquariensis subsp. macquariensis]SIR67704.1 hypothetical protein SAMN05421578_13126 [Paenibacillus macquariensis]
MVYLMLFLTPIVSIIFFVNCVAIAKKIKNGDEDTANNTGWGAVMFGYIIFMIILSGLLTQ